MADKELSDLTSGGAATTGDVVHVLRGPNSRKATLGSAAGKNIPFAEASSSGPASLEFAEDTDNGSSKVTVAAPVALAADRTATLPDASGTLVLDGATQTLTNKTLADPVITGTVVEDIYTITDGVAFEIDPSNGSIQQITLTASRTPAATNFANGEGILLMVNDGTAYTITWTTVGVVWIGGTAPTLATTGWTHIVLWKVGGTIYGKYVGTSA